MKRFVHPAARRRTALPMLLSVALGLLIPALLALGASQVLRLSDAEQLDALRQSVLRATVHCYAVEGSYPPNLAALEARYGLVYDKEKFLVDYRAFASNLMPDITVIRR